MAGSHHCKDVIIEEKMYGFIAYDGLHFIYYSFPSSPRKDII